MVFCLLLITAAYAQQTPALKGILQNEAGSPLAGAEIEVSDLRLTAVSDSAGRFSFRNLPRGNHAVQVRAMGYRNLLVTVSVPQTAPLSFTLKDAVVESGEVVVTGSGSATEKRRSPLAIASIRQAEMLQNGSTNIVDALTRVPGVSQISTGPAISKPVIRGLGYNRTVVIADGIRQEGQQWGDEHGLEADDYQVERVEILKGPASLAYGSDALAGVINILTDNPVPQGQMRGQVLMNYQTNSGLRALHGRLGGNTRGGFSWNGWATGKEAQDYQNCYDERVFNSRFQNLNFGGAVGIAGSKGSSKILFSQFTQHLGLVEGDRDSAMGRFIRAVNRNGVAETETASADANSYTPDIPAQRIRHRKIVWSNSLFFRNGNRLNLTLGGQENVRREYGDVLNPDAAGLYLQLRTGTYDLRYVLAEKRGWSIALGSGGMMQQNRNLGAEFLIPDYRLQEGGLYSLIRHQKGRWLWSGGLRFDARTIQSEGLTDASGYARFAPFTRSFQNLSGSVGASYTPSEKLTLRVNAASGYRAPNIAELAANGVHEGTFRYEYGNRDLKAERSYQVDLGATFSNEHLLVDAALFYNRIANYIFIRKLLTAGGTDSIPTLENPENRAAFQFVQGNAALLGGELFIDLHPHPLHWLHFQNTFAYVAGNLLNAPDSMRYLPLMPPFRWMSDVRADKAKMGRFFRNGYVKTGLDFYAAQNRIFNAYETETNTPGYWLWSAGAGVSVVSSSGRRLCDLILSAQNLTDAAWQSHLSRLKYAAVNNATGRAGVWGAGRNISFTLVVPLGFVAKQS